MRGGGRETNSSHEDALLSGVYEQVIKQQERRPAAEYDLTAGLDRYRTWLRGQTESPAREDTAAAGSLPSWPAAPGAADPDPGGEEITLPLAVVTAADFIPAAFLASSTTRTEWSADHAVIELYSVHYRALVRLAAMLVRDTPTAEEVVQDSFVAMHDGWKRLKDTDKALAYLRQAVVNKSRSVLRHRMVVERNPQKAPPDMPSAEHGAFVLLERHAVVAALRDLPDRQREAIALRYYGDLSEAEIACAMGISRGAVKSHTARAMAALRAALEQESS